MKKRMSKQDVRRAKLDSYFNNEVSKDIERSCKLNIDSFDDTNFITIHSDLIKLLNVKSKLDSKYFDIKVFGKMILSLLEKNKSKAVSSIPKVSPTKEQNNNIDIFKIEPNIK
jgi:hypothetical protein